MARDDEILERLDGHMARSNEYMARGNELMARSNELMDEVREEHRLNRLAYQEGMRTMAQLVDRQGRFIDEAITTLRLLRQEFRDELRLVRERMEAQTDALLLLVRRLEGNGGSSAGG